DPRRRAAGVDEAARPLELVHAVQAELAAVAGGADRRGRLGVDLTRLELDPTARFGGPSAVPGRVTFGHPYSCRAGAAVPDAPPLPSRTPGIRTCRSPRAREPAVMRILLVDDHGPFREAARLLLEAEACEVVAETETGEDALALLAASGADVVLIDIH